MKKVGDLSVTISKNVRWLRKEKGWTQSDLGAAAEIDRRYVARIERGTMNIGADTLERIANALGVPPAELVSNSGEDTESLVRRITSMEKALLKLKDVGSTIATLDTELKELKKMALKRKDTLKS